MSTSENNAEAPYGERLTAREFLRRLMGADIFHDREGGGVYIDYTELYELFGFDSFDGKEFPYYTDIFIREIFEQFMRALFVREREELDSFDYEFSWEGRNDGKYIPPEQARKLESCHITIDDENTFWWRSVDKYPDFALVGKPLTEEQAAKIDSDIKEWDRFNDEPGHGFHAYTVDFPQDFWNPDRSLDMTANTTKYPDTCELIQDGLLLTGRFPFLDMMIALRGRTDGNWEHFTKQEIIEGAEIGVYIHDGDLEIMDAERARKKISEYNEKYGRKS